MVIVGGDGDSTPKTIVLAARGTVAAGNVPSPGQLCLVRQIRQPDRSQYGVSSSPRVVALGETVPKGGGTTASASLHRRSRVLRAGEDPNIARGNGFLVCDDASMAADRQWRGFDMTSLTAAPSDLPIPSTPASRIQETANR